MCHFITAILPRSVDPDSAAPVFTSHGLGFQLISNQHVSEQIEPGDLYILTTRKHCDCGTAIGSLAYSNLSEPVTYERELKKFRKRGWSETRIRSWLEGKEGAEKRRQCENQVRAQTSIDNWTHLITDLLTSGMTRRIGLLLHWYGGSIGGERIRIVSREKVRLKELNPEQMMRVKEDVLYEFVV